MYNRGELWVGAFRSRLPVFQIGNALHGNGFGRGRVRPSDFCEESMKSGYGTIVQAISVLIEGECEGLQDR